MAIVRPHMRAEAKSAFHDFMRIVDLMTKGVICVAPGDSVAKARELFRVHNIHHLVVLDRARVAGVLSIRDVISKPTDAAVESVMSRDVKTVGPNSSTREVAAAMIGSGHGCVPVVDGARVVGIVTTTDLLRILSSGTSAQATA